MANMVINVLLTGPNSRELSPYGYTYFKEGSTKTFSDLEAAADRADDRGQWFSYKDHFLNCNNISQIEDMLQRTYGEVPHYYPASARS